jgi:LysR family cyn operon transcriptional activator
MLHFTRAAESLFISQPSLSVHIQQLEDELKTKLFARVGRNVLLTESGQVFLGRARRAVDELEEGGKEIDAMTGLLRGSLTIATISLFGSRVMPAAIETFIKMHPQVRLNVRSMRAEDIESGLVAGTFDLGFSLVPAERTELISKEMLKDRIVMIVARDHPLTKKKKLGVEDLRTVQMALPSHKLSSVRHIGTYFETIGLVPNIVVEQDDGHALLELAKLGSFATFLPTIAIKHDPDSACQDPNLVCLELPPPGCPIDVAAMWTQLSPAAKEFLDVVSKQLADRPSAAPQSSQA